LQEQKSMSKVLPFFWVCVLGRRLVAGCVSYVGMSLGNARCS